MAWISRFGDLALRRLGRSERKAANAMRLAVADLAHFSCQPGAIEVPTIKATFAASAKSKDCAELAASLERHGSDKSARHDYCLAYAGLLAARRREPLRILEIGIGTNNPDVASSMGSAGRPGASLRAWRDWGPRYEVHGADIDKRILFAEERIATQWVDQTRPETLEALERIGPGSFDLVIDDGLHRPDANINTLLFATKMIKPDGLIVIEDILKPLTPFWLMVSRLLAPRYEARLLYGQREAIFIVREAGQSP